MMRFWLCPLPFVKFALLGCVLAVAQSTVSSALNGDPVYQEYTVCSEKCEKSFSPHTNPDAAALIACKRGCRFSLIATVSEYNDASALSVCKEGCHSAYSAGAAADETRQYACRVGCANNVWDRSYQGMLEQEMCSWIILANYLQYMQHRLISSLPTHTRLVSLFVSSDGHSGVLVSGSFEQVNDLPQQEPVVSQPHKDTSVVIDKRYVMSWLFFIGFSLILFYVALDFAASCFNQEEVEDVPIEKKPLSKTPEEISLSLGTPMIPPGKLVEVIVQEV